MTTILTSIAATVFLLTIGITLLRLIRGPSNYDRVLALNAFSTKTILLLVTFQFLNPEGDLLDIAILYALIGFITSLAVLRLIASLKP